MSEAIQAVKSGDTAELQRLIDAHKEATFREKDSLGEPLLHSAILAQKPQAVAVLVRAGIDIDEVSKTTSMTPLQRTMISVANAEIVQILLSANAKGVPEEHRLAWKDDIDPLKKLAKVHLINIRDSYQNSVMHYAVAGKAYSVIAWLLSLDDQFLRIQDKDGRTPFLRAAANGCLEVLKVLQGQDANIRAVDKQGCNALHLAALSGNSTAVEWLLDVEGAPFSLEDRDQNSRTPFLAAAIKGRLKVLKVLQERGANIRAVDKQGYNALHLVAFFGNSETIGWLLDLPSTPFALEDKDQYCRTPFLAAAEKGQLKTLKALKTRGANTRAIDKQGCNALHLAALSGNSAAVEWLLDFEGTHFSLEDIDLFSRTPFLLAAEEGHLGTLKVLKTRVANTRAIDKQGCNALHLAALSGNSAAVEWLLDFEGTHFSLEDTDSFSRTSFLIAAKKGQLEALKALEERGANIRAVDKNDNNALHLAAASGNSVVVEWLLDLEGALVLLEGKNRSSLTPFLAAVEKGQLEALKVLEERGANIRAVDKDSNNALHLAAASGNRVIVGWLLDLEGALFLLESKNRSSLTPFLLVAKKGQLETFIALKERDANILAVDNYGRNVLHLAAASGNKAIVEWLLDFEERHFSLEDTDNFSCTPFLIAAATGQLEILKALKERGANIRAVDKKGCNALHLAKALERQQIVKWLQSIGF